MVVKYEYPNKYVESEFIDAMQDELLEQIDRIIKLCKRLYIEENKINNSPRSIKNKRGIQRSIDRIVKDITKKFYFGFLPNSEHNIAIFWNNMQNDIYSALSEIKMSQSIMNDISGYLRYRY